MQPVGMKSMTGTTTDTHVQQKKKIDQSDFYDACERGDTDAVVEIVKNFDIDPALYGNRSLRNALERGHEDIVKIIINLPKFNPTTTINDIGSTARYSVSVLPDAVMAENAFAINALLNDCRVTDEEVKKAFQIAVDKRKIEALKVFLNHYRFNNNIDARKQALSAAIAESNIVYMNELLSDPRVRSFKQDILVWTAYPNTKNLEPLKELLKITNPADDGQQALVMASVHNNFEGVKLLLKDERVNPRDIYLNMEDPRKCYWTILKDHKENLRQLLDNLMMDSSLERQKIFWLAVIFGSKEHLRTLLKDPNVDPTINGNEAILHARKLNHINVVNELLKDRRINTPEVKEQLKQITPLVSVEERNGTNETLGTRILNVVGSILGCCCCWPCKCYEYCFKDTGVETKGPMDASTYYNQYVIPDQLAQMNEYAHASWGV